MWNYAQLSTAAKNAGGPEAFMEGLVNEGLKTGRIQGVIATLAVATIGFTTILVYDKFAKPSKKTTEIVDKYMKKNLNNENHEQTQSLAIQS